MSSLVSNQEPIAKGLFTWPSNDPRLLGSRCNNCGVITFPAKNSCPACSGVDTETIELERRGTLWTYTEQCFYPKSPPYDGPETPETFKPFAVGYVELPGQTRVQARIKTDDISKLRIGMTLELVVEKYIERDGKDIVAYFFQPVDEID
ncbi:MAG: Zn-ribbon domain-containing OB-fold protein [Pseudomonadota bacterium]